MNYKDYLSKHIGKEGKVYNFYGTFTFYPDKRRTPLCKLISVHEDFAIFERTKKSTQFTVPFSRLIVSEEL